MKTVQELEQYLMENCYSFVELTIGRHFAHEGFEVVAADGVYRLSYKERGHTSLLKAFSSEEELVAYTLAELQSDPWSNAHCVATTFDKNLIQAAERDLEAMGISYKRNDVPNYHVGQTAYRIFVFGRDILRLERFRQKYRRPLR